jgi:hypothetical protein
MWTKNNKFICDHCGLFAQPYDSYTPFGCSSYDPPEPLDPTDICKKCSKKYELKWLGRFKDGPIKYGHWYKSKAEIKAAKKCGLVWIHSSGVGTLGSKNYAYPYQYITKKEHKRLSKHPYYGYCGVCGTVRKGSYCSDPKCEKSFETYQNKLDKE